MPTDIAENTTTQTEKGANIRIGVEDARRLKASLLEQRRLALKFAQSALDTTKILDEIVEKSVDN